jgi:hypothetical protein
MRSLWLLFVFNIHFCGAFQSVRLVTPFVVQRKGFVNNYGFKRKIDTHVLKCAVEGKPLVVEGFGKGLLADFRRKKMHFKSEITDGWTIKTAAATAFLFFACLAPAVAFGGILAKVTGGLMGTMETVGATAVGGLLYALFSAQPLTIIGTTGPLLAFVKVVYSTCQRRGLPFLPIYSWIGLWTSAMLFLSALFSTSNVVEYFTRFTDDIFSSLISVIFIYEAVASMLGNFTDPLSEGFVACGSTILALLTYFVAMRLKGLRKTSVLPRKLRQVVSDFAPTIGVGTGIAASRALSAKFGTVFQTLVIPNVVGTTSGRPWLVDIFSVNPQVRLACGVPAIMAFILLFMDQNITVRLVNSNQNKLKKGSGLHMDMLVVALITTITSLFGMPWMVAATVRSMAHVRALQEYEPSTGKITSVQEQRISGIAIHSLIGAAVIFGRDFLRCIPNAVLTGKKLFYYIVIQFPLINS